MAAFASQHHLEVIQMVVPWALSTTSKYINPGSYGLGSGCSMERNQKLREVGVL